MVAIANATRSSCASHHVAIWSGWHSFFDEKTFAVWVLDFVPDIVFQYFAIVPMRGLSPGKGIIAALKAALCH